MKEAMWSIDPEGQFKFSDKTSDQTVLFDLEDHKADGKKRRPKSYPEGTVITFPDEWSRIRY
jgi:hypothetical protein